MNKKTISVIIPVHNTKLYLRRCLESVVKQSYPLLEIICVDDGSTDGAEKICDEFAKADSRVKVIHQANQGVGAARNRGLEEAQGEYVGFVDSDDWIEPEMYEVLVEDCMRFQTDISICGFWKDYPTRQDRVINNSEVKTGSFDRHELFRYVYIRDEYRAVTSYLVNKLFCRDIIEQCETIRFDESLRINEDLLFFLLYASRVKYAVYNPSSLYHYVQRSESVTHVQDVALTYERVLSYKRMILYCKENNIENETIPYMQRFMAYWACVAAESAYEQGERRVFDSCQKSMIDLREIYKQLNSKHPERLKHYDEILSLELSPRRLSDAPDLD